MKALIISLFIITQSFAFTLTDAPDQARHIFRSMDKKGQDIIVYIDEEDIRSHALTKLNENELAIDSGNFIPSDIIQVTTRENENWTCKRTKLIALGEWSVFRKTATVAKEKYGPFQIVTMLTSNHMANAMNNAAIENKVTCELK